MTDQAVALHRNGKLDEATRLYRDALASDPRNFTARHFLGVALAQGGQAEAGLAEVETALLLRPTDTEAYLNRANILRMLGRKEEALADFNRALAARPNWGPVLNNRGGVLQDLRRFDEALADFDRALALQPHASSLINNRGSVLLDLGRAREALAAFDQALQLAPDDPVVLNNHGNALRLLGRYEAALESYDRAIALNPGYSQAHSNRAGTLQLMKRYREALQGFEAAMALDTANPSAFGGAAMAALNLCDFPRAARYAAQMPARVASGQVQPWGLLGYSSDEALQRQCAEKLIAARFPVALPPPAGRYSHDRLRIGYISSDFGRHPVTSQLVEVIERHDRKGFAAHGFAITPDDGSAERKRITAAFDHFHDVSAMPPEAIARLVRELEMDILVDLNGHTQGDSFDVLARRPAPVQASWLGYAGTTGAPFLDVCIADRVVAPDQAAFSERLEYLPHSFMPHDTTRAPAPAPSRAEAGLPQDAFVFCSFNHAWKFNAPLFGAWVRLLRNVENSVLWLRDPGAAKDNLLLAVKNASLDTGRVIFAAHAPTIEAHLARLSLADLFLDTLPYNAHATACDALWAGVPVVTARGTAYAGRVAASLLTTLDLPELIADTPPAYEALALELAQGPARLKAIREKLAANRKTSPLFDMGGFTRDLEALYRRIA
jgi:predicted O-linked N-acetylglucosamine transferase (SPINDLY family)